MKPSQPKGKKNHCWLKFCILYFANNQRPFRYKRVIYNAHIWSNSFNLEYGVRSLSQREAPRSLRSPSHTWEETEPASQEPVSAHFCRQDLLWKLMQRTKVNQSRVAAEYGEAPTIHEIKVCLPFQQSFPSCCPKVFFKLFVVERKYNFWQQQVGRQPKQNYQTLKYL